MKIKNHAPRIYSETTSNNHRTLTNFITSDKETEYPNNPFNNRDIMHNSIKFHFQQLPSISGNACDYFFFKLHKFFNKLNFRMFLTIYKISKILFVNPL